MRPRPLAVLASISLAAVVLTGCSSSTGGGALDPEDSPLAEYMSALWGGDLSAEEQQKLAEEYQRDTEELVSECMSKEGFEYIPSTDAGSMIFSDSDYDAEWKPEDRAWVEEYGYGMVTSPFSEAQEDAAEEPTGDEYVDPNQDYVEALSTSEQEAYYATLYGPPVEGDGLSDEPVEYTWENGGCQGWAQHEVEGENVWESDEFADLRDRIDEFTTAESDSPELADLDAEWSSCMADAGEPGFARQSDASESIGDEQNAIYEKAYGDETADIDPDAEVPDPDDGPEMKALGKREVALALVDLDCREKTSYIEKSLEIRFALEEQFVADNKADLDALKAAAEQGR